MHVDVIRATHFKGTLNLPLRAFRGEVDMGRGSPHKRIRDFLDPTQNYARPGRLPKKPLFLHLRRPQKDCNDMGIMSNGRVKNENVILEN